MALIVETGTGSATAESYISVADATTYHANRGNTAWAALASDTVREQVLRKATDYMEQVYRMRWAGVRATASQALSWPRDAVQIPDSPGGYFGIPNYIENNVVPDAVKNACAELALKSSSADLFADENRGVLSEKIGPIETQYDPNSSQTKRYKAIDGMLKPYLEYPLGIVQAVRR
jgi:hypothetical protein